MLEILLLIALFKNGLLPEVWFWLRFLAVFWIPIILAPVAFEGWVGYVRRSWIRKQKKVLLEVKLPQETFKSPAAMELVLHALHQTGGEGTPIDRYWEGKVRPWFSLEIASIGGDIRFFIWTFEGHKNFVTSNIYAQYPDVTVNEVDDYTKGISYDAKIHELWGAEFEFTKPSAYPIKTYMEYGLDKNPDEEFKIDPIAPLIEFLGTLKKDNQVWVQMLVRAHKKEKTIFNKDKPDEWVDSAKEEITKIMEGLKESDDEGKKKVNALRMTDFKRETVKAIEKGISKYAFDVCMRALYIAPKAVFEKPNQGGIAGSFKQFGAGNLNGFKPKGIGYDYKWQDFGGKKVSRWKAALFRSFVERSYFHYPYPGIMASFKSDYMVMNTEELATVYHFPGSTVKTPTLKRIPSKRADAPSNLPI